LSWLEQLGQEVPAWTVVLLTLIAVAMIVGGRILDLVETTATGVEAKTGDVVSELGGRMPDYRYKELARGVWAALTTVFTALATLLWVAKAVNAFIKRGEEL